VAPDTPQSIFKIVYYPLAIIIISSTLKTQSCNWSHAGTTKIQTHISLHFVNQGQGSTPPYRSLHPPRPISLPSIFATCSCCYSGAPSRNQQTNVSLKELLTQTPLTSTAPLARRSAIPQVGMFPEGIPDNPSTSMKFLPHFLLPLGLAVSLRHHPYPHLSEKLLQAQLISAWI